MGKEVPMINALFACAMVEKCSLPEAAKLISAPHSVLVDAYKFRLDTAHGGSITHGNIHSVARNGKWITDYHESITESFKRLEAMN